MYLFVDLVNACITSKESSCIQSQLGFFSQFSKTQREYIAYVGFLDLMLINVF